MNALAKRGIIKSSAIIISSTIAAVIVAIILNYIYGLFDNDDVHTVHIMRIYLTFFSYPFIPAMIGGIVFGFFSKEFIRTNLLITIGFIISYFLLSQNDLNASERFVIIFLVFLPLVYLGVCLGNYIGQKLKKIIDCPSSPPDTPSQ